MAIRETSKGAAQKRKITKAATRILLSEGMDALTTRRVAKETGMSLGNLQHYFGTRVSLIAEVLEAFLVECKVESLKMMERFTGSSEARLREFIGWNLESSLSERWYRVLSEIWGLSRRDEAIAKLLSDYYSGVIRMVAEIARLFVGESTKDQAVLKRIATAVVALFEGYAIMGRGTPITRDEFADLVYEIASTALEMKSV